MFCWRSHPAPAGARQTSAPARWSGRRAGIRSWQAVAAAPVAHETLVPPAPNAAGGATRGPARMLSWRAARGVPDRTERVQGPARVRATPVPRISHPARAPEICGRRAAIAAACARSTRWCLLQTRLAQANAYTPVPRLGPALLVVKRFKVRPCGALFMAKSGYLTPASAVGAMMEAGLVEDLAPYDTE